MMQTSSLRPAFALAAGAKNFLRTVAVNAAAIENGVDQVKTYDEIPGPSSLPFIGQLHHFLPWGEFYNMGSEIFGEKLYRQYGPIVKLKGFFGRPDFIMLFDPESCAQVLRSENWMPIRPGFPSLDYYRREVKNKGEPRAIGLLTDYGHFWKEFRSTVNPILLQPKTIKLYRGMLDEVAQDMIARMKAIRDKNNMLQGEFDFLMNLWSLESISLVALSRRLNCFNSDLPAGSPEKKLIQIVHDIFVISNELDFKPSLWRYFPTAKYKRAMNLYEEQENVARYFLDKSIEELEKRDEKKQDDEKGVLEKLLEINKDVALVMATDMLLAGVDTTSNTMIAILYLLATNQEKQDKLRQEILSHTDPLEKRVYLKACIKESIRMMPVAAGNLRVSTKNYNILGYNIPKGTQLTFIHQTMSLLEEQFPRANEFFPERWTAKKGEPLYHGNAHPFAHQPFGFGVRSCIGRRIVELELETFLARVIEHFKVEWFGPPIEVKSTSLNYVVGPFNFIFKDAKK